MDDWLDAAKTTTSAKVTTPGGAVHCTNVFVQLVQVGERGPTVTLPTIGPKLRPLITSIDVGSGMGGNGVVGLTSVTSGASYVHWDGPTLDRKIVGMPPTVTTISNFRLAPTSGGDVHLDQGNQTRQKLQNQFRCRPEQRAINQSTTAVHALHQSTEA